MKKKLISSAEATPAKTQHTKPCSDCPWARDALPGWLGSSSAEDWIDLAHSDGNADCHVFLGADCAGMAIYRANVCKMPRDPKVFQLGPNKKLVFASPTEFIDHHTTAIPLKGKQNGK